MRALTSRLGGGDYCCLSVARGNKLELDPKWYWRHANPKHSAGRFVNLFRELRLSGHQISGDAGGLGIGFLYDLQESDIISGRSTTARRRNGQIYL